MDKFIQLLAAGLVSGTIYAMIATGYAVVYTATGFVNFALGAQAMLGGYFTFIFFPDLPLLARLAISIVASAVLAVALWSLIYRNAAGGDMVAAVIASFGISIVIAEVVLLLEGSESQAAPSPFGSGLHTWASLSISNHSLGVLTSGVLLFGVILAALASKGGLAIRAMFQDAEMAEVLGIRTKRVTDALLAASGAIVAVAGMLAGPILSLDPFIGQRLALIGFVGAVLGGLGRVGTAIAGGLLLGILEAGFSGYVSADFRTGLVYLLFIGVLIVRPVGLFGRVARVKV